MWFRNLSAIVLKKRDGNYTIYLTLFRDAKDQDFMYFREIKNDGYKITNKGNIKKTEYEYRLLHWLIDENFVLIDKEYFEEEG